jgi:ABC-2 type transport system permease protein
MRKIATIVWKDTILRFSSAGELLFFLVLPIAFILILGGGIGGGVTDGGDSGIPLLLVDEDGTALSAELATALAEAESVRVEEMAPAEAEAAFADEEAPVMVRIPAGFADSIVAGETAVLDLNRQPNDINADAAARAVETAVTKVSQPLLAAHNATTAVAERDPFADAAARERFFRNSRRQAEQLLGDAPQRVRVTQPETANVSLNSYDQAAHQTAGQLITWVFIPLLGASAYLALERQRGALRRLLTTPTTKATFMLGSITAQLLHAAVQMALLVGFGMWVMGVDWGNSTGGLALLLLAFALAAVAFGVMLGAFVKTVSQANNVSIMLGMSMALLGGCWWPLELFPPAVQTAVHVLPTTWAMQGLVDLSMRGQGFTAILPETAVLFAFAAVFFVVGIGRFRYE